MPKQVIHVEQKDNGQWGVDVWGNGEEVTHALGLAASSAALLMKQCGRLSNKEIRRLISAYVSECVKLGLAGDLGAMGEVVEVGAERI